MGESQMPHRAPSTCPADELKQIAAIKFEESVPTTPGQDQNEPADRHQNLGEMKHYLASNEL
jgi:hypothetical protein